MWNLWYQCQEQRSNGTLWIFKCNSNERFYSCSMCPFSYNETLQHDRNFVDITYLQDWVSSSSLENALSFIRWKIISFKSFLCLKSYTYRISDSNLRLFIICAPFKKFLFRMASIQKWSLEILLTAMKNKVSKILTLG